LKAFPEWYSKYFHNNFLQLNIYLTMANYALGVLAKGQAIVTDKNQAPEQRRKMPTVMELALKNKEVSIPNADELRVSPLRTVEINYFKDVSAGSGTAKAARHTGSFGDSGKVELVYVKHVETFHLPRKIAENSIFAYEKMFANLYEMKWKNLRKRHDDSALSFLASNKCQLSQSAINAYVAGAGQSNWWNETNFALEVSGDKASRFIQMAKNFMAARLFPGNYDVVADLQLSAEFEFAQQQGAGNSTNLGWQYADCNIAKTTDQITSAYDKGSIYMLPATLFSGFSYNEPLNKKGVNEDSYVGSLGTVADPFGSGAIADISMYTDRADTSANTTGGSTQDIMDEWELSLEIAYALPPLTTSGESVLHQISQIA
jgi:hypothetical protein